MIGKIKQYLHIIGVRGLVSAIIGKITKTLILLPIKKPNIKFPLFLRIPSSDAATFDQVFLSQDYDFDISRPPKTIVDAGANIGLASIYFANKFPNAKIIAIEPEESNLEILRKNIAPYNNIICVCGALWHQDSRINLVDPGLGKWGFMTQAKEDVEKNYGGIIHEVQGITVNTIMKEHGIEHIDILKMDIEGAELEVFSDPYSWIENVDALIVELHERMKPGCTHSFYSGARGFDHEWLQDENVYKTREGSCLISRGTTSIS